MGPSRSRTGSWRLPTDDPDVLNLSNPNFYLAEHQLANFQGTIVPDKDRDESRITVNRDTGTVSKAENKLQINMPIVKHPKITVLEKVADIVFPVIWVNNMYSV